ncbi:MAG: yfkL [Clostridiaceae bacterium]|nr:yfkL [Clostridiaceae bacterium]
MFKNEYVKSALGIYISYGMLGMVLILISTHMAVLTRQFNTDAAGIGFLISTEGIVRSATLYITGKLSDKLGRKRFLCLAPVVMSIFLIGIPLSPTYQWAMFFSAFAGIAHAFMDASSYPSLIECFPKTPGTATVIIKLFIAIGAGLLPFIIVFFANNNMFYGYTFFVIALITLLNGLFLFGRKFPQPNEIKNEENNKSLNKKFRSEPILKKEGLALIIIGFTSNSIFTAYQTWMPTYGQKILDMSQMSSLKFISYYSMGAIISVLALAKLLQKSLKPIYVLLLYPAVGLVSLVALLTIRSQAVTTFGFFIAGITSAGVLQMAQTTMGELFWKNKGASISLVSTASGIAAAVIPGLTGLILRSFGISHVFYFLSILYVIGISCAIFANLRYRRVCS